MPILQDGRFSDETVLGSELAHGSQKQHPAWPEIGKADIPKFCRELCASITGLEHAFENGELSTKLKSGDVEQVLGPWLYETYKKLVDSYTGHDHHRRVIAVRALLAQLQNDLLPTHVAEAQLCNYPEAHSAETDKGSRPPFEIVEASFDGVSKATLRFDQMLDLRFWRIGFNFERIDHCDAFAQAVARSTSWRLASDLLGLQRILHRFSQKPLKPETRIVLRPGARRLNI